ncbi:MarR family winged helix-turn-helix transcriptional regulator [Hamadaea tsunoensis]|uniref:MarR family winged helix-turn-helix transcriptional regulator n=1 Tax=Hamadaea tsunoensis TaxID=53368 RepID=UPI0003FF3285|nr:MarR family transcriptional regulator [Hamadaea tsunoensis]
MTSKDLVIARIMAGQRRFQAAMARDRSSPFFSVNLTMQQLKILFTLRLHGGTGGQELAHLMGVSPATMTGIVDRLVAAHYVTRREDPQDRRVRRVQLTPAGDELIDGLMTAGEEHQTRILSRLSVDELTVVADAMEIMQRALAEDEAAGTEPSRH